MVNSWKGDLFGGKTLRTVAVTVGMLFGAGGATAQRATAWRDPVEPAQGAPKVQVLARPAGAVTRASVDEKSMRALIDRLVVCGTRLSIAAWDDPKRGPGCGRDQIVARLNEISKSTGGKLQVMVDSYEGTSVRTSNKPMRMENVYAILPGTDAKLA